MGTRLHKLIKGELKEFRHATLDGLINKLKIRHLQLKMGPNYCINDMLTTSQIRQTAEILSNNIYPSF